MSLGGFFKPEYLFRPRSISARLGRRWLDDLPQTLDVPLLGRPFRIRPRDVIGQQIMTFGLYDLVVTECLLRLTARGDAALDVGANIGFTARIMAHAVGEGGSVTAFEPHPDLFSDLVLNIAGTKVCAINSAVSDRPGKAVLRIPAAFAYNRGIATMESVETEGTDEIGITMVTLDQTVGPTAAIGMMKLDVEGHELAVLNAAKRLIAEHRIRNIIFEDHRPVGSPVIEHLRATGYTVRQIRKGFWGPIMVPAGRPAFVSDWEPPCFLATVEPAATQAALAPRGWRALRG